MLARFAYFIRSLLRLLRGQPAWPKIPDVTIIEEIANGGFATVYKAYQPSFNRTVAVKLLHVRHLNRQQLLSRFERECKALGMLDSHPNVVRVFQAGISDSGNPYLVMEYLPAGSLADQLDRDGPLPWNEVVVIGVKLAGALESAHRAGVLHRDIKPGNVLIGQNDEPKLADFGIARLRDGPSTTTETPTFSLGYAAPEVLEEHPPTKASDVYGLGAMLFTLLAGHPPFVRSDDDPLDVVYGRTLFAPVTDLRPSGVPDGLCAVIEQAMAKSTAARFGSAVALGEALQDVQHEPVTSLQVLTVPAPRSRPSRNPPPSIGRFSKTRGSSDCSRRCCCGLGSALRQR